MTTANQLIERAYEIIGFKDPDEPLSGSMATKALAVLNDMVDSWNTQRLYIVSVDEIVTTVSGLPITIGPGMMIDVARPIKVEDGSFTRISGVDYQIKWVDREEYNSIAFKSVAGQISLIGYYDANMPTGNIFLWPYPVTGAELHLQLQKQLSEFSDLATDYSLAPGYRKAISYSLAEELAPGLKELSGTVVKAAALARKAIRRTNAVIPQLNTGSSAGSPLAQFLAGM